MDIYTNYMRTCKGEKTDWIPNYMQSITFFTPQVLKDPNVELYGMLEACGGKPSEPLIAKDCYGIPWQLDDYGPMVAPRTCLFEEMTDWRGHFQIPDLSVYSEADWDRMCREDAAFLEPGKPVQMGFYGPFTQLYNAMGFENAMIAVCEEPEEILVLFEEMTNFLCELTEKVMARVRIDSLSMYDDIANASSLFISRDNYAKLVKPFHKRVFDTARRMNPDISLEMHCCGKCDSLIDDFVEIGTNVWQPAQVSNDLKGIREKYGTRLVFNGAWDNIRMYSKENVTEEELRQSVRDCIDAYGRDGGLIFWDQQLGNSEEMQKKISIIGDEVAKYGKRRR